MATFIIRSQGFFYTDEYYAPGEVFRQVVKATYPTKMAAEAARAALVREWVRAERIGDYVFDDEVALAAVSAYLRAEWPDAFTRDGWLGDAEIPKDATDPQVDEIVKRMGVTFAQVFEVDDDKSDAEDDDSGDGDGDDLLDDDAEFEDDALHFGPTR